MKVHDLLGFQVCMVYMLFLDHGKLDAAIIHVLVKFTFCNMKVGPGAAIRGPLENVGNNVT